MSIINSVRKKRHSYTPPFQNGSYTVEACVCLPLFLIFSMLLLFCIRVVYTQWKVECAMENVVNKTALLEDDISEILLSGLFLAEVKLQKVPEDYIEGGFLGFQTLGSEIKDNRIYLRVSYGISYPLSVLGKQSFSVKQQKCARIWNGYDPSQGSGKEGYVYVTKYGKAYHRSKYCKYIDPTIRSVAKNEISSQRNADGGRYERCSCCRKKNSVYYITTWGDCYHGDIHCSGLKRTVYRMKETEAKSRFKECPKCGH